MKQLLLLTVFSFFLYNGNGQFRFHSIFDDHMVIQANEDIKVYGFGSENDVVIVDFGGKIRRTTVKNGKWQVNYEGMPNGGPFTIKATAGSVEQIINDVMIGWVILCSGQSNMEWGVGQSMNAEEELDDADYPMIRLLTVNKSLSNTKKEDIQASAWQKATITTVEDFSAVGFFTARNLYKKYQVPIGLIDNSWGGSEIDPYMDNKSFEDKPSYLEQIKEYQHISDEDQEKGVKALKLWYENLESEDVGMKENWKLKTSFDSWDDIKVPGHWEDDPALKGYDGVAWYAHTFDLSWVDGDGMLSLGMIDDSDSTFLNGVYLGGMKMSYNKDRRYFVPKSVFREGANVITVKVADFGGGGGITGQSDEIFIEMNGIKKNLAGPWKIKASTTHFPFPTKIVHHNDFPTSKYNAMMYPLLGQKLFAILWYQGEGDATLAEDYKWKFRRFVQQCRDDFGREDLPFLFVQLAAFLPEPKEPVDDEWARLREAQASVLDMPHTAMVSAIDAGDADDIHPKNKQILAERLAFGIESMVIHENKKYLSTIPSKAYKTNEGYIIEFENIHGNLTHQAQKGDIKIAVPSTEGSLKFVNAELGDNKLMIPCKNAKSGVIRYLWSANPGIVSLYNGVDQPVPPFEIAVK